MYVVDVFAVWGGLERVWTDKMNALSDIPGYEVCLVTTDQDTHQVPYPLSPRIRHIDLGVHLSHQYRYNGVRRWWMKWHLSRLFRDRFKALLPLERPDILITTASEFSVLVSKWKGDIPLVIECHGLCERPVHMQRMTWLKRVKTIFIRRSISNAQIVVALTQQDARQWKNINVHSVAIPNIVHLNESGQLSTCQNHRIIFVGRPDEQKGYYYLKEIWQIVSQRYPDWELHLYGEELDTADFRDMLPMGEQVFVHSQTLDIHACYQESAILVLTSVYEPFGLVMPEAMSCGIPVVAFNCPYGPSEVITDGVDGFLIPPFDVETFAERLSYLMADETLRKQMGQKAAVSSQRYHCERIIPLWTTLFEQLKRKEYGLV